jgi:antitoxin YefM
VSTASYTEFRQNMATFMDRVCDDHEVLHVTRQKARTVVVIAEDEYAGLAETAHLLRSPANARRLFESIVDADAGEFVDVDL